MITFTCCLIALIVGYFTYGKFVERVFGVDPLPGYSRFHETRWCRLYTLAYLEDFHDPIFEYSGSGTYFRRYHGG